MTFEQITVWAGGITTILGLISLLYHLVRKIDIRDEYEANKKEVGERFDEGSEKFEMIEARLAELQVSLMRVDNKVQEIDRNYNTYLGKLDRVIESNTQILVAIGKLETKQEAK